MAPIGSGAGRLKFTKRCKGGVAPGAFPGPGLAGEARMEAGLDRARYTELPVPFTDRTAGRSTIGMTTPLIVLRELALFIRTKDHKRLA